MVYGRHAAYNMILKQFSFFFPDEKGHTKITFYKTHLHFIAKTL